MAVISTLTRSLSTAVSTVRPIVVGVVGRVVTHLPGRSRSTGRSTPETFAPSRSAEPVEPVAPAEPTTSAPSPATIARNVAAPRPSATSPAARKPRPAPGAKLPVRRPAT